MNTREHTSPPPPIFSPMFVPSCPHRTPSRKVTLPPPPDNSRGSNNSCAWQGQKLQNLCASIIITPFGEGCSGERGALSVPAHRHSLPHSNSDVKRAVPVCFPGRPCPGVIDWRSFLPERGSLIWLSIRTLVQPMISPTSWFHSPCVIGSSVVATE